MQPRSVSAHEAEKKLIVETQKRLEEVYLEHVGSGGEAAPMDKDEFAHGSSFPGKISKRRFWDFLHVDSVRVRVSLLVLGDSG